MMPPWYHVGVPRHFHSSTISGSAAWMISRTFASIFPRQSPSSLIRWSISAEADSTGTDFFMDSSNARLQAAPAEVRDPPEHAAGRCPAPRVHAIAYREMGDEPRSQVD